MTTRNLGNRLFFSLDSAEVTADAARTAERLVALLRTYPELTLMLEGHADERGTRDYNLALGQRRADSIREYMLALGTDPARLATVSWGKERPTVLGANETAWSQNRRVVALCRSEVNPKRAVNICRYIGDTPLNHDDNTGPSYVIRDGKLVAVPAKIRIGVKQ
jgi:peptidoglycan-associated lipoprotein